MSLADVSNHVFSYYSWLLEPTYLAVKGMLGVLGLLFVGVGVLWYWSSYSRVWIWGVMSCARQWEPG
jgi:hypothetical protein